MSVRWLPIELSHLLLANYKIKNKSAMVKLKSVGDRKSGINYITTEVNFRMNATGSNRLID